MRRVTARQSVPRGRALRMSFALIELLVVISIVAILLAVLLPTLARVRKQARTIGCRANLRQSGVYFAMYAAENNGLMLMGPVNKAPYGKPDNPMLASDERWMGVVLGPSLDRKGLLLCPLASKPKPTLNLSRVTSGEWAASDVAEMRGDRHSAWVLPYLRTNGGVDMYVGSFGLNISLEKWVYSSGPPARYGFPTVDTREAPRTPVHLDNSIACVYLSGPDVGPPPYEGGLPHPPGFSSTLINRHDGGVNCLFMDWSVRKVGLKGLWTLKWTRGWNTAGRWTKAGGVQPEDWPEWMRGFKDY